MPEEIDKFLYRHFKRKGHNPANISVQPVEKLQSNLSYGVIQGKDKKWLLKTGDPLIQVHLHYILVQGTKKRWLLKTGDPLIEVTT